VQETEAPLETKLAVVVVLAVAADVLTELQAVLEAHLAVAATVFMVD
jgi:hypothetical protein